MLQTDFPEETDEEGLSKLLRSLPDDVLLTVCAEIGLMENGGTDD